MHALRGDQYKYIRYYGLWDTDNLYDIKADPLETKNLVNSTQHQDEAKEMNGKLFETLANTNGMYIQLYPDRGRQQNRRREQGSKSATHPPGMTIKQAPPRAHPN